LKKEPNVHKWHRILLPGGAICHPTKNAEAVIETKTHKNAIKSVNPKEEKQ